MKKVFIVFFALLILASCRKKVEDPIAVEGISLPETASVEVNATLKLQPAVSPANAADKSLTWTTNAPDIATVDGEGVVTGKAVGEAIITATSKSNTGKSAQCAVKVEAAPIPLTGLSVNPAAVDMLVAGTQQLAAIFNPADATDKNVTWTSSDETKATVSATGLVTATALGPVTITVKSTNKPDISTVCQITVKATAVPVASVEVTPPTLRLQTSDSPRQLTVKVKPAGATNANVTWTSSDASKATVDASGLVTPLAKGITTITATSVADASKKAVCEVTVTGILVSEITIPSPATTIVGVGLELALTATVKPDNADNKEVTWSSDKLNIATVDATGKVRGVAKGIAIITATAKDERKVTKTITLTVRSTVTSIAILPANPVVNTGVTTILRATVVPADATQAVAWSSSDVTKATIGATTGVVTGVAVGTTTITATATDGSGRTATTTLTVKSTDASVTSLTLGTENFNVNVPAPGNTTTLNNAPRPIASNLAAVRVNISAAAGATIKIGAAAFTTGNNANFTSPVVFTVTAQDGTTIKTYTVGITAYHATSNPYGVYTVAHLRDVHNDKRGSYKLMNTITLPDNNAAGAAATGIEDYATAGWLPIAHDAVGGYPGHNGFAGTFDGAGFRIENLYVNRTIEVGGLFGGGNRCTIKNLEVRGTTTKTSVTITKPTGRIYAGILIGSISRGTITDCSASGDVAATAWLVGGLAGCSSQGSVINCFATGNINAGNGEAGGLIGFCSSSISKSYATGNVTAGYRAGGLVGGQSGQDLSITDCFATGNVSGSAEDGAAGLLGSNMSTRVTNSYATGNVSSTSPFIGRLIGRNLFVTFVNCYLNSEAVITKDGANFTPAPTEGITPKTKTYMQTNAFKANLNGTSGTVWGRDDSKNDKLPYIIGVGVGK